MSSYVSGGLVDGHKIEATLISQTADPVKPGEFVELRWKIENIGKVLNNVEFELLPEYPFSLTDSGIRKVGSLYGKQQGDDAVILYYKLKVDERAVEGISKVKLKYKTNSLTWTTFPDFDVRIQTDDAILSVVSVNTIPEVIAPGEKASIEIKLKNEADSVLKNIKLKWTTLSLTSSTTELPFTPIKSTNEKILNSLHPKNEESITFNVVVSPEAEAKDYKVELSLSYEDELGENFSTKNIMGIIVGKTPELRITLEESEIVKPNMNGDVGIKIVNKGVSDIKFTNIILQENECYTILSPHEVYLGNIDSDDYETAEFKLHMQGCNNLPIILSYKDANNQEYIEEHTLNMKLFSEKEAIKFGLIQKSNKVGILLIIIIVVGGFYLWRRYKK